MKQSLRNQLYNTVVACRRLLERDSRQQLEGTYSIHDDGSVEPLWPWRRGAPGSPAARRAIEQALTHLPENRDKFA